MYAISYIVVMSSTTLIVDLLGKFVILAVAIRRLGQASAVCLWASVHWCMNAHGFDTRRAAPDPGQCSRSASSPGQLAGPA